MVNATLESIGSYYDSAPRYLSGPLEGTCHFAFTADGKEFDLKQDLLAMENLLAEKLDLEPGSLVFDGGCGYGRVAKTLAETRGLKVIGGDLNLARLVEANRFVHEKGQSDKVSVARADYCHIPLKDESVHGAYTMETLVHADPLESALSEFKRILKPGGKLVLFEYSAPRRDTLDPVRGYFTDMMNRRTGMASMDRFHHGAFEGILKDAGFVNIKADEISKNVYPNWKWFFERALSPSVWLETIKNGNQGDLTNLMACLMIYTYRSQIGYNVVSAEKPMN